MAHRRLRRGSAFAPAVRGAPPERVRVVRLAMVDRLRLGSAATGDVSDKPVGRLVVLLVHVGVPVEGHVDAVVGEQPLEAVLAAEAIAPTRPHAGVESAKANFMVGPFASMLDRARDAIAAAVR